MCIFCKYYDCIVLKSNKYVRVSEQGEILTGFEAMAIISVRNEANWIKAKNFQDIY